MRAVSIPVAALLFGTMALVAGALFTFATTVLGNGAAVVTLVVLVAAVAGASALGALAEGRSKTPYW